MPVLESSALAEGADEAVAVEPRHVEVQQDQSRPVALDEREADLTVLGFANLELLL